MFLPPKLNPDADESLYRQLYRHFKNAIESGELARGDRLPATRELAGAIGLNRTTVTAAYELLEAEGLIRRHVGRGSFVEGVPAPRASGLRWRDIFVGNDVEVPHAPPLSGSRVAISFATSRPAEELFPLEEVRATAEEVIAAHGAEILQLGSPAGYPPLRRYLLEEAHRNGTARDGDDIIVTNGCQQAIDLLQRVLIEPGDTVAVEDPVYPGVHHVLGRGGARLLGVPVEAGGVDLERLERALARSRPKLVVLTPNFQNPTGATLPLEARRAILRLAREHGVVIAENDIYAGLRYQGAELASLKQLDESGCVVQLRSFSKIAFPGLRVGWVIGPCALIARLADAKQWSDLHTDQLSQAVLCRFAESGRLEAHRQRVVVKGRQRLAAAVAACGKQLPPGSRFTRPEGGMNLWVELPEPLEAGELLPRAHDAGVSYLPGRYFAVSRPHAGSLRLSFAGLTPEEIHDGIARLGGVFRTELERARDAARMAPAPALV